MTVPYHAMPDALSIVGIVAAVFSVVGVGALARWLNWLDRKADESLLKLVIRVLVPCFFLDALIGNPRLLNADAYLLPPLLGLTTVLVGYGLAWQVARRFRRPLRLESLEQQRTFSLTTGLYNYGYLPYPIALALFDRDTLGVLVVFNVGVDIAMWTFGVAILTGGLTSGWWRRVITPPTVAIVAAMLINVTGLHAQMPDAGMYFVGLVGGAAVPMALLLIGATIADHALDLRTRLEPRVIGAASTLRLALLPLGFLAVAMMLPTGMTELRRVLVLQAAMPAATFPILLARAYDGDAPTAVRITLGTTLLGLVTVPFWLILGQHLID